MPTAGRRRNAARAQDDRNADGGTPSLRIQRRDAVGTAANGETPLLQNAAEGVAMDAEEFGGCGLVAVGEGECALREEFLEFL